MEDSSLVEPLHNTPSSVEFDIKHSPYSLGLNLNTNRGSSHLSTNGVSSFSGKAGPSGIQGAVEALTSLTQEPHNGGETDSEPWKNCEAKWLQLFHLVEKQCQEQIVAQQEQFHSQVQRIQEEIKNLVKLQSSNASWAPCDGRSLNKQIAPERQMGFFSENSDRNESVLSYPKSEEPDMRQETSTSQPDCTADSSSVSSGYGTLCVSELNICKSTGPPELMEPGEAAAGCCGAPAVQTLSPVDSAKRECFFIHSPEGCGAPSMEDGSIFPGEFEHSFLGESNISEVYSGKTNSCKAVTSWAQKLKQSHLRGTRAEEGCPKSTPGKEPTQTAPAEKSEFAAATQPPAFYLSNPDASPNPWLSDSGAGLTYWKLEGRDLSPSSPGAAGRLAAPAPSTVLASQFNTSNEMKLPSLKDIYHKKQRENKQLPVRGVTSASSPNHPPEVLTLAPALLGKPRQQVSGSLNTLSDRMALTPDSVLEPSMSSHSDMDSFSQASHGASQLSGFPKFPSGTKGLPVDSWKNHAFPRESRSSSTLPSVYTLTSNDISVSSVEEHTVMVTPAPVSQSQLPGTANSVPECISLTSLEDPVILSNVRQTLKEKHARHIADLRAYYESEINCLKQKLEAKEVSAVEDWKKNNQILIDRCSRLDGALKEATGRVRTLENKNNLLERDVSDFRERLSAASSASKILQERIEEMRTSNKEKDNTIVRLKSRLQDLEEAFEDAYKLSDDKEARLKQENKMFHDLLGEYESLGKEHERVKDTLNITENKLLDAQTQISDLKRTISKLEAQVKQVEHENMLSLRHSCRAPARPSRANTLATSDVSRRKWLIPGAEYSIFTGQPLAAQDRTKAHQREESCTVGCRSPPKKDSSPGGSLEDVQMKGERETSDAPIMRALKELEEEKMFKNWGTQTEKEDTSNKVVNPQQTETWEGASPSPERCSQPRQKRSASAPQRASSLPPASRKPSAPTKREIMLTPVTVARSPKRSPKENLSPGFSHLLSKAEGSPIRFDMLLDDLDTVPGSASQRPGRRSQLQSLPLGDAEEKIYSEKAMDTLVTPPSAPELAAGGPRGAPGWAACGQDPPGGCEHTHDLECTTKARTLAETERFFDELTKEKDQIEAALNRMPSPGGRASLQTRLNQEALEERLERVNRELGSVRMTLKKLHVLRTSANL